MRNEHYDGSPGEDCKRALRMYCRQEPYLRKLISVALDCEVQRNACTEFFNICYNQSNPFYCESCSP